MKTGRAAVLFLLLLHCTRIPAPATDKYSTYAKVAIHARSTEDLAALQRQGITLDHYAGGIGKGIEVVLNLDEVEKLQRTAVPFTILIPDMDAYYRERSRSENQDLSESLRLLSLNGIHDFRYGSMGGYLTYDEMVRQLDTMRLRFPNLITAKESLGVSEQGRTIWGVEISDNPGIVEPGEAVVHYDALHHAREPQAMATIMYYMYWLLDNYGTNSEATYLVNNRRMCFVPIVNVDGYVYNQTTNPNGGGSWRKNRRNNGGGVYGVDLNRNYGYMWGYDNNGSSPNPSSDTYRGPSAFSEPEARAVRDFAMRKLPSIAMSAHSVAGRYLNPYSYKDTTIAYEYYAEFASDFSAYNNYLYGTVFQMLDYNSNGTTRDFLHHDLGCYSWTPEVGGSGFWPLQSEIVPVAQENLLACKYLSWIAGGFADYQSFDFVGRPYALRGDTLRLSIRLKNKGVSLPANNVVVTVQALYPHATPLVASATYPSIPPRQFAQNAVPISFLIGTGATVLDEMKFVAMTSQDGIETSRDTFSIVVGFPRILFAEDAENGIGSWTAAGSGVLWDTTFVMAYRGARSIADSRYGNVANSTNNTLTLNSVINLAGAINPRLEFYARWANEASYDYVRVQVSTNGGAAWTNLAGRYTTLVGGQPSYTANKGSWAWESIPLTPYLGQQIKLRFNLITDTGLRGDGFYVDELRVADYRDSVITGAAQEPSLPRAFALEQNYPNPFNPTTTIAFSLPAGTRHAVSLRVYDVLGRDVATLVNEVKEPGEHHIPFDASALSSGMYFYQLRVAGSPTGSGGSFVATKAMLLLR